MKKILVFLFLFGCSVLSGQSLLLNQYISESGGIPTDYIAYYPFNGNANDESGNGFNGVVTGAILTTDRFGKSNKAYFFDGIDDYIEVTNFDRGATGFTISVWFNTNDYTNNQWIVNQRPDGLDNSTTSFQTVIYNNYAYSGIYFTDLTSQSHSFLTTNFTDNHWHHYLLTTTGLASGIIRVYFDGVNIYDNTIAKQLNNPTGNLRIGRPGWSVNNPFDGEIDDIRIYKRLLTSDEALALYHEGEWVSNKFITEWDLPSGNFTFPAGNIGTYDCTFGLCDVSSGTDFTSAWNGCSSLTTIGTLDVSSGTDFSYTWFNTGFVTFPQLTWGSPISLLSTWDNCTSLTSVTGIGSVDITALTTAAEMLDASTLVTSNYDELLIGWEGQIEPSGITLDGGSSQYSAGSAATAKAALVSNSWIITDGGEL